ncbi:MAG: metallophosphoesterase family protein, partial [Pseudomonadota bacterium]
MSPKEAIFAIGDIHGCAEELKQLIAKLPLDQNSTLVFLGDYVDRGEDSKGVVDYILFLKKKYKVVTLMGNHEKMFLEFLKNEKSAEAASFVFNGGNSTLGSYGDDTGMYHVPAEHSQFFKTLQLYYVTDKYCFVHAGVPDVPVSDFGKKDYSGDFLWVRENFFESEFEWDKLIIHGHTPKKTPVVNIRRINIDTGCVFGGTLTALQLPDKKFYQVAKSTAVRRVYLQDKTSNRQAVRFTGTVPVLIQKEGKNLPFVTINYSEFGMLLCSGPKDLVSVFAANEIIH